MPRQKTLWLIAGGGAALAAGYLWALQFPIIKAIWTSSFVLITAGYSAILLAVVHQIVDVWQRQRWATPFIWIGANAITLYFLNDLMSFQSFAARFVGGDLAGFLDRAVASDAGGLLGNLVAAAFAVALAGFLYRRKIFLRV